VYAFHPSTSDGSWLKSLELEAKMAATDQEGSKAFKTSEFGRRDYV
jgi:hypothetical protein